MAYPPCNPKLVPLSSADSPLALGILPHLPLSPIWEQEAPRLALGLGLVRHRQHHLSINLLSSRRDIMCHDGTQGDMLSTDD